VFTDVVTSLIFATAYTALITVLLFTFSSPQPEMLLDAMPTVPFLYLAHQLTASSWPWDGLKLSHAHDAPGFKSRSRRAPPLVFYMSCSVGCVWGFWWFPPFELHVYSSMWSEAEALSEYGVVPE
jgi:hypothetical protein